MYCRCCGKEVAENAEICMNCGVPVGKGKGHCPQCGAAVNPEAVVCVSCGRSLAYDDKPQTESGAKSGIAAGLLGIFIGAVGAHNFYLGYYKKAVAQLLLSVLGLIFMILYVVALVTFSFAGIILAIFFILLGAACIAASSIWALVEAIMLLCGAKKTDGKGNALKN